MMPAAAPTSTEILDAIRMEMLDAATNAPAGDGDSLPEETQRYLAKLARLAQDPEGLAKKLAGMAKSSSSTPAKMSERKCGVAAGCACNHCKTTPSEKYHDRRGHQIRHGDLVAARSHYGNEVSGRVVKFSEGRAVVQTGNGEVKIHPSHLSLKRSGQSVPSLYAEISKFCQEGENKGKPGPCPVGGQGSPSPTAGHAGAGAASSSGHSPLGHHEENVAHGLHKAAETMESAHHIFESNHLFDHPQTSGVMGYLSDFIAKSVPKIREAAEKYHGFLQKRYGDRGAAAIMAAGAALSVGSKMAVHAIGFVPLANYLGSVPALAVAEVVRAACGACPSIAKASERVGQVFAKIPGLGTLGKAGVAYAHGKAKTEDVVRKVAGKVGRGVAAVAGKAARGTGHVAGRVLTAPGVGKAMAAVSHAETSRAGSNGEKELTAEQVQSEAVKFSEMLTKTYQELLDEHKPRLEHAANKIRNVLEAGETVKKK